MHEICAALHTELQARPGAVMATFPGLQLQQQHSPSLQQLQETILWGMQIRLTTLYDVVDFFVIVESRMTHQGRPKALQFADNRRRFAKFEAKIAHVVLDDLQGQNSYYKCAIPKCANQILHVPHVKVF